MGSIVFCSYILLYICYCTITEAYDTVNVVLSNTFTLQLPLPCPILFPIWRLQELMSNEFGTLRLNELWTVDILFKFITIQSKRQNVTATKKESPYCYCGLGCRSNF